MTETRSDLTREERTICRRWARVAWERELTEALDDLLGHFERWKRGRIDAFELNERIHEHHQGASRDLYRFYARSKGVAPVARAVAVGLIDPEELDPELLSKLSMVIRFFEEEAVAEDEGGESEA